MTLTGWRSFSMICSPHFSQTRLVRWLISSRLASEARAVFESSPFFGMSDYDPLSSVYLNCWNRWRVRVRLPASVSRIEDACSHSALCSISHSPPLRTELRQMSLFAGKCKKGNQDTLAPFD